MGITRQHNFGHRNKAYMRTRLSYLLTKIFPKKLLPRVKACFADCIRRNAVIHSKPPCKINCAPKT